MLKVNLIKKYKDIEINVKEEIKESVGIIGESGSGKTTLAMAIGRLIDYEGKIYFNNENIKRLDNYYKNVQYIFQNPNSFNPKIRPSKFIIDTMVNYKICNKKTAKEKLFYYMDKLNLSHNLANSFSNELSLGQLQRLSIIRAICLNPQLIICDEITSGLDIKNQEIIFNLLKSEEFKYIFISHNLKFVENLCNEILVMHNGCVIEKGKTYEILNNPKNEYTKQLLENKWK